MPSPPALTRTATVSDRTMKAGFWRTTAGIVIVRVVILIAFLIAWEYASGPLVSRFWVSSPSAIFAVLKRWVVDGSLWMHLEATVTAIGIGYLIGCGVGIGVGLLLGFMPRAQRVLSPFLSAFYSIPKIALAPLFVIALGIGIESKIGLVAITVFFLVLFATLDGIRDVDADLVEALQIMGANRREVATKVIIPAAKPWILTGMRISVRYAMTAAILGEVIAANRGIGFLIEYNSGQFNASGVFAAVFLLVFIGVLVTELLTRFERGRQPIDARL
jgi:NitT/TauT family transport system permease protein